MEVNREEIIKALECCTSPDKDCNCPLTCPWGDCCEQNLMYHALVLIKEQDEQIFKLENRLKECENGYEQTLYLDRCKLHDAEQKIKELTEKNERLRVVADMSDTTLTDALRIVNEFCDKRIKRARADTVRALTEKLTTFFTNDEMLKYNEVDAEYINEQIDKIAKEMLGEV